MGARLPPQDAGDRDHGDYDSTEVISKPVDVWHPSHAKAEVPHLACEKTEAGRAYLNDIKGLCAAAATVKRTTRKPVMLTCWKDTPQLYRRMVVAAAGLSAEVVNKIDRDLSESEKVMIRSAVTDMRNHLNMLVSL